MNTGVIKLSHFSVKEYLLSTHVEKYFSIDEKTSHVKILEISIAYLLQFDDSSPLEAMLHSMPLAMYAAEHWIDHVKFGGVDSTVLQLILQLFISESAPFINWIGIYDIEKEYQNIPLNRTKVGGALYYSSLAGVQEVSESLLVKGENANAKGGRYGNPLQAASHKGYEAIVKLLLKNGAEENAEGGEYGNALQAASYGGNEGIVKLLLKNGAEVNAEGGEDGNAL